MKTLWCICNEDGDLTTPHEISVRDDSDYYPDEPYHFSPERDLVLKSKCHPTELTAWEAYKTAAYAQSMSWLSESDKAIERIAELKDDEIETMLKRKI